MDSKIAARRRYAKQREHKTPPHISLKAHRESLDPPLYLDALADRVEAITGERPTKGAISAIENGLRGVSAELLDALNEAYGFPPGTITTDYVPRASVATEVVA